MRSIRQALAPAVATAAAVVGAAIALYHYAAPMTGVTGTAGALGVIASSVLVALAGLVLWFGHPGGAVRAACVFGGLLAFGTLAAGWLLHEVSLVAAMLVALLAVTAAGIPGGKNR